MTPRSRSRLRTLAAALTALTAASCGSSGPSSRVGSQPSSPDVSAFVVDCSGPIAALGEAHGRYVAAIKLINNTTDPQTFHLVVDGQRTAGNNSPATMTLGPHHETTTTYQVRSGATLGECQALDVRAVKG